MIGQCHLCHDSHFIEAWNVTAGVRGEIPCIFCNRDGAKHKQARTCGAPEPAGPPATALAPKAMEAVGKELQMFLEERAVWETDIVVILAQELARRVGMYADDKISVAFHCAEMNAFITAVALATFDDKADKPAPEKPSTAPL